MLYNKVVCLFILAETSSVNQASGTAETKAENEATLVSADGSNGGLADVTVAFPFLLHLPAPFLSHPAKSRHDQGRKEKSKK